MKPLPLALYTAAQTRVLDQCASEQWGLSIATLMARAGQVALSALKNHWPQAQTLVIFCGVGHNGGDGMVLAKLAVEHGYKVTLYQLGDKTQLAEATSAALRALTDIDMPVSPLPAGLPDCDLIIDALLGSGINREVSGDYAAAIELINNQQATPVFALDIPSGLNADTGQPHGQVVKAALTLSFLGLNAGLFTGEAADYCGEIVFDDLAVPHTLYETVEPIAQRLTLATFDYRLAARKRTSHKGMYGHVAVVGGDQGMSGAVRMAAEASLRMGAGLVTVLTHPAHAAFINLNRPELMCQEVADAQAISALLADKSVVALGMGLGQREWGQSLFNAALQYTLPMVVDADGLNLLAKNPQHRENWILTPHPGEAARLLGWTTAQVQHDRYAAIQALHKKYGGVVVLKGAGTLITDGTAPIFVANVGNPGMSSGGMGDILTGVIAALMAQHVPLFEAACFAVLLHGIAADQVAALNGERGLLAMDLLAPMQSLLNEITS